MNDSIVSSAVSSQLSGMDKSEGSLNHRNSFKIEKNTIIDGWRGNLSAERARNPYLTADISDSMQGKRLVSNGHRNTSNRDTTSAKVDKNSNFENSNYQTKRSVTYDLDSAMLQSILPAFSASQSSDGSPKSSGSNPYNGDRDSTTNARIANRSSKFRKNGDIDDIINTCTKKLQVAVIS